MKMIRLLRDQSGAGAAEFAMVLPLLMILTLGAIDAGRYLFELNQLKKASQYGSRFATVTNPVEGGIVTASYVDKTFGGVTIKQGDRIPANAFTTITCDDQGCDTGGKLPADIDGNPAPSYNNAAFRAIVDRMKLMYAPIDYDDVEVRYDPSGLGFAGDPNGADVAPIVTVAIKAGALEYRPITAFLLASIAFPSVATSLTLEDASSHTTAGSQSN